MYQHEHRIVKYPVWERGSEIIEDKTMRLDYYVYESDVDWEFRAIGGKNAARFNVVSYGIGVTETALNEKYEIAYPCAFEDKLVSDVTHDYAKARDIIKMLADNCVTPCSLQDALEDICASELTVEYASCSQYERLSVAQ